MSMISILQLCGSDVSYVCQLILDVPRMKKPYLWDYSHNVPLMLAISRMREAKRVLYSM
jgi:hypothetical protein